MNREGMCKIAEEINKELGAEIKINTKSTTASLIDGMREAVENFEGKAQLSQTAIDFLCEKEIDVPAQIKVKTKTTSVKPAKEKKEKTAKGPGVIATIVSIIERDGPISADHILKKLEKKFPSRASKSMRNTINLIPNWSKKTNSRPNICKNEDGELFVK